MTSKQRLFTTLALAVVAAIVGYRGWTLYGLSKLERRAKDARSQLSKSATPQELLGALAALRTAHAEARQPRPLFSSGSAAVAASCEEALRNAPELSAGWIQSRRREAWSLIGSEEQVATRVSEKSLAEFIKKLGEISRTGLEVQDQLATAAQEIPLAPGEFKGIDELASQVKHTATLAARLAFVGEEIVNTKARARSTIQRALIQIDGANQQVDAYAELPVLRRAADSWSDALRTVIEAASVLESRPIFPTSIQNDLAEALIDEDRERIRRIVDMISPNVQRAHAELERANRQESTVPGQLFRGLGRLFTQVKEGAGESRMGKEVALAFKTLVLGTKVMYDLMEIGPNDDLMSWAASYGGDLNQLSVEAEEIRASDGWSVTGKNTFVEEFVDRAYEGSFKKE